MTAEIWLVQAKWSHQGTARLASTAVHNLLNGFGLRTACQRGDTLDGARVTTDYSS
ncbi:hypothetical protein [Streptomyces guryensis]|uniref:Uncharacterized protein n=1 Tax=Streptomyces guryensis TaxID=2886947 RepID=A0A9Q3Z806_9ACTN|nr:hypothetical protein [Streptomyces guryensis]MCD9872865.1 hypothetical protein [Streptomyces guryensis]